MTAKEKKILIVDDEVSVRSVCARILSPRGYVVTQASNSEEALQTLGTQSFDLLLTDYRMPGTMDGLRLIGELRQRSPGIRAILMTAFPSIDSAVDSLRLGAIDYLVKPFDANELLKRVETSFASASPGG